MQSVHSSWLCPRFEELCNVLQHFRALAVERRDFFHDFMRAAMHDFLAAGGVLHAEVKNRRVDRLVVETLAFGRVGKGLLQLHELPQVGIIERVGFAEVATRIKLVVPSLASRRPFLKEEHDGLYTCTLEGTAGAVEHGAWAEDDAGRRL